MFFIISPLLFISIFLYHIYNTFFPNDTKIIKEKMDPILEYVNKSKEKFIKTYMNGKNMSENIESEFYNKKEYNSIMKEDKNVLEFAWQTRILYENTPKGQIFMHYDAYKQGFSYYSDQTNIPFNILNAVAMKYVCRYFCRDFYYDEMSLKEKKVSSDDEEKSEDDDEGDIYEFIEEVYESPLIKIHNEKEETEKSKEMKKILSDGPFAKFKKNNDKDKNNDNCNDKGKSNGKKQKKIKERNTNKFINLGKIYNFHILQKKNKIKNNNITTSYDAMFSTSKSALISSKMSYKDFKQKKHN